jgi:recombination protein RecA
VAKKEKKTPVATAERDQALERTLGTIEKAYGKGAILRLGDGISAAVAVIPTGSLGLDEAIGVGGLPRGRMAEIFGPEGSGKTTLALHALANAQAAGGVAAFIDAEHALDPAYARALGVDLDGLLVAQPDWGEQALEIADLLVRSNAVDIIVIDSVAALVPKAELDGEMGQAHVGLQARLMSQALRKLTASVARSRTCLVFINQIRMRVGVLYGNPETTTGGRALKFYAAVRLDIRRVGNLTTGEQTIGALTRVKVVKNKVAPPFRQAEFELLFGQGISREGELLDLGAARKILAKSGNWWSFGPMALGNGREQARQFLKGNPETAAQIAAAIAAARGAEPEAQGLAKAS